MNFVECLSLSCGVTDDRPDLRRVSVRLWCRALRSTRHQASVEQRETLTDNSELGGSDVASCGEAVSIQTLAKMREFYMGILTAPLVLSTVSWCQLYFGGFSATADAIVMVYEAITINCFLQVCTQTHLRMHRPYDGVEFV